MRSQLLLCCASVLIFVTLPVVTHAASCTGTAPTNATLCANDNKSVTVNTPYALTDQCTDAKCEYTCKTGFARSGNACVQCTGAAPVNATLCNNDDAGLAINTVRTLTDQCTDMKCEYTCNEGFVKYNNICVGCIGTTPTNAQMCVTDDQGLTKNVTKTVASLCTDKTKCEFTCNAGFAKDGTKNNCVTACKGTPSNATMCADDDRGVATALASIVSTSGCTNKKCEFTCNLGFAKDPVSHNCVKPCTKEPSNANMCVGDDQNMTTAVASTVLTTGCKDNAKKCEFTCKDGFAKDGAQNNCISACKGTPTNATMCTNDNQNVPTALSSTVVLKGCTDKTKCEFTCNSGFAKDPKTNNCVYPCLNAQSSAKSVMCAGDDQGIGATAIASTVKAFGSQCTDKKKCEFICKKDYMLEGGKCIPKQCSGNTKPALQSSDPECWTSQTTSSSRECTWDCTYPYYACDDGVQTTDPNGGTNCQPYLNACYDNCGNYAGCSNRTDGIANGVTYTLITYSTTYNCHYITVNTWGDCNVDTGVQLATSVTQNIAQNTKDCTNLSQATVRYCGICGNGIQEADEACDDGNQIDGDGCSGICRLETGDSTDGPTDPSIDPRDLIDDSDNGEGSDAEDDNDGTNGRMIETRP